MMTCETLLRGKVFDVERRCYTGRDGSPFVREVVVHPGAVLILPVVDPDRLVMIRNLRRPVGEELLELPAGTLEPDEPPVEAAGRELEEETGFVAGRLEPMMEFYTTPGFCTEKMLVFVARELTPTRQRLEAHEQIRLEIVEQSAARRAITDGTIRDGKTLAALGAYFRGAGQRA